MTLLLPGYFHLIKICWLLAMWCAYHDTRASEHHKDKQFWHITLLLLSRESYIKFGRKSAAVCSLCFDLEWAWQVPKPGQSVDNNWIHFWNLILSTWPYINIISMYFWFWIVFFLCFITSGEGEKWKNKLQLLLMCTIISWYFTLMSFVYNERYVL